MTALESALEAIARAASHRYAPPAIAAFWLAFRGTAAVEGVEFLMTFVLLHSQGRESRALQAKADALVLHSEAPNECLGLEDRGSDEIERARELTRP